MKRLLSIFASLLVAFSVSANPLILLSGSPPAAGGGGGSFALVAHTVAGSSDGNGFSTSAIDTTGANLLVMVISDWSGSISPTEPRDFYSNTWTLLQRRSSGAANATVSMWYTVPAAVGSGHTFTAYVPDNTTFATICVAAFSGANATPADQHTASFTTGATSLQPGSVTPSTNNQLVVSGLATLGTSLAISGYTITDSLTSGSNHYFAGLAYKIQTTAAAENPTWTWATTAEAAAAITTFKP